MDPLRLLDIGRSWRVQEKLLCLQTGCRRRDEEVEVVEEEIVQHFDMDSEKEHESIGDVVHVELVTEHEGSDVVVAELEKEHESIDAAVQVERERVFASHRQILFQLAHGVES